MIADLTTWVSSISSWKKKKKKNCSNSVSLKLIGSKWRVLKNTGNSEFIKMNYIESDREIYILDIQR